MKIDPGIGSDRLQKAIERNRRKRARAKKGGKAPSFDLAWGPPDQKEKVKKVAAEEIKTKIQEKIQEKRKRHWFSKIVIRVGWAACFFLLLRLIFAERGMMDYYERKRLLQKRHALLQDLKLKNAELVGQRNEKDSKGSSLPSKEIGSGPLGIYR